MAVPAMPTGFVVQTGNGQNLVTWDITPTALSYIVQRSTDNITFASVSTPTTPSFLDTSVALGTKYWYKVAGVNGDGTGAYTASLAAIPAPTAEKSLFEIRNLAKDRADLIQSTFVPDATWNTYINQAMFELYDLLVTVFEDYFKAPAVQFTTVSNQAIYDLPNGTNHSGAAPFYKLLGVDLGLGSANNAWVTLDKYNFMDRNRFVYPNTASTIYGVFNLRYRVMGSKIEFTPTPTSNQVIQLHYIPRLPQLLKDTDLTTIGISGWLEYVIVRAAKYALDKEESDTSVLAQELMYLKQRIEESAANRDAGRPDTITDTRQNGFWGSGSGGYGWNGPLGGF